MRVTFIIKVDGNQYPPNSEAKRPEFEADNNQQANADSLNYDDNDDTIIKSIFYL